MHQKAYFVYIITNFTNTTLYTGITNDIYRRVAVHKNKTFKGFSQKYNLGKLVYYEVFATAEEAIIREKKIKGRSRKYKIDLIINKNPFWKDLSKNW